MESDDVISVRKFMMSSDHSQNTIEQSLPGSLLSPLCFCTFYVDKHSRVSDSQGSNLCHSYVALGMVCKSFRGSVSSSIRVIKYLPQRIVRVK